MCSSKSHHLLLPCPSNENIVRISALKDFIASLGLPGSFLGLPVGFLRGHTLITLARFCQFLTN